MTSKAMSRRSFLGSAAGIGPLLSIVPRRVIGHGRTPPSDRLHIAGVGVGGMGASNLRGLYR
jgi:hypothetical protein